MEPHTYTFYSLEGKEVFPTCVRVRHKEMKDRLGAAKTEEFRVESQWGAWSRMQGNDLTHYTIAWAVADLHKHSVHTPGGYWPASLEACKQVL